jgi:hypothetical protein
MSIKIGKAFSLLLITLLLISATAIVMPTKANTGQAHVEIVPNFQEFGDPINHETNVVGTHFTINIEVHDVENLYGVDIQIKWDTKWIHCVSHTKKIPVETYPDGILHTPTIPVKDQVDESASMPGSAPGTMYWLAEASMAPAAPFTGSGIAATLEFVIMDQPVEPAPDVTTWIQFTAVTLSDSNGIAIPIPPPTPGEIIIHWIKFTYPPEPLLKVMPEEVKDVRECNNFVSSIWLMGEDHGDLNPLWDIAGFDIKYNFDPTLIEAVSVTIDPDGWFASFWPGGIFIVKQEIDNTAGTIWIVFLGLPNPGDAPPHIPPYGKGRLAEITFHSIYESETYPPASCPLSLAPTTIAGWPHPERPQAPWYNSETSPAIPHKVEDGVYKSFFKPPGAWIDIYTQYPEGYNGVGPNQPSDMFWPQKKVILYAYVTYNFWPEQQKDVAFEVRDPHGTIWAVICNRTDSNGIAWVEVRLPWPCDDPEYYFGVWSVIATVDVACKVVNDTLTFKYDYHVRIWKTTTDKESYKHCETIAVTIDYGTYSMQTFPALFTVTIVDETGVPFGYTWTWDTVGGAQYCTYKNGTFTLYIYVPKFARAGQATIYVQVLHNLPNAGGDSIYPTREPETIIHVGIEAA